MRGNEVVVAFGSAVVGKLLHRNGVTREKLAASGVCEDEGVIDQCAELVFAALAAKGQIITPTTYGPEISPPFASAKLIDDGPGDEVMDVSRLRLLPVLTDRDGEYVRFEEAVRRSRSNPATNWGQRAAYAVRDAGNAGKISLEVWPVGVYAVFTKTSWRGPQDGRVYAWWVIRYDYGFLCYYRWFGGSVHRDGRLPSLA